MITFISTLYNEEKELTGLIEHVLPYVDKLIFIDDGSRDLTPEILKYWSDVNSKIEYEIIEHTGMCELARIKALEKVDAGSWVIMLDADERFDEGVLPQIVEYIYSTGLPEKSHIYFDQLEFIDGIHLRTFQKAKVFLKESITLPEMIHGDPQFTGDPVSFKWIVIHRKSKNKQITREVEYLATYKRLLNEGKIDQGKYEWFCNLHYYVVPHG